jgi:hypothetical protein
MSEQKIFRGPLVNCFGLWICLPEDDSKPFPFQNKKYLEYRWLIVANCGFACLKTTAPHTAAKKPRQ